MHQRLIMVGYVVVSNSHNTSGQFIEHDFEDVYTYTKAENKLVVKYIDEDGNQLADMEEAAIEYGSHYEANPKTICGYKVKAVQGNASGTMLSDQIVVVFIYTVDEFQTKDLSANVEYRLGDKVQEDDTIRLSETVQLLQPDAIRLSDINAKTYTGWVLDTITLNGVIFDSVPETIGAGQTLSFNYVRDTVELHVIHQDKKGTVLSQETISGDYGDRYQTHAKSFAGYEVVSDSGNTEGKLSYGITVTYTYQPVKTSVTIKYTDSDGMRLLNRILLQANMEMYII